MTSPKSLTGLTYELLEAPDGRNLLLNEQPTQTTQALRASLTPDRPEAVFEFFISIPPGQLVGAGDYISELTLSAFDLGEGASQPIAQALFNIRTSVAERAEIGLSFTPTDFEAGSNHLSYSFGQIEAGDSLEAYVLVRSNVDYVISASSDHQGALVAITNGEERRIPYRALLEGRSLDLANSPVDVDVASTVPTGRQGVAHRLEVTVLEDGFYYGTYEDVIRLSVKAQY
jgi:hypothetical protein